jgi:iron(III) transport system ATP-binding protein
MISIVIDRVTKRFGETVALDQVALRIEPGEIFFLLGPSGCGKTTLLRTVAGFYLPDEGRILFGDEDVTAQPPHLRQTGMMFQSYALWPHMNVFRNVAFGLEERRVPSPEIVRRVNEALASVQMAGFGDRRIHQLSGGQQQRVALARALVIRPRCLLLDEPLSNLDAKLRLEMRGEIRRICKQFGLTASYVTHDQKEALSVADRMAVLDAGRLRQLGTPAEIYRHPDSRFVAEFMGETNFIPGTVASRDGEFVRVRTALGTFEASLNPAGPWQPRTDDTCTLSVRPESWRLSSSEPAGGNAVRGTIREQLYLGEMAQYTFAAGDQLLKVSELNPRVRDLSAREPLFICAERADLIALPSA